MALCPGQAALGAGSLTGVTGGRTTFETNLSLTDQNTTGPPFRSIVWLFNLNNIVLYTPAGSLVSPAYRKRISLNTTSGWLDLWDLTVGDSGAYTVDITTHTDQQLNGSTGLNVYGKLPWEDLLQCLLLPFSSLLPILHVLFGMIWCVIWFYYLICCYELILFLLCYVSNIII